MSNGSDPLWPSANFDDWPTTRIGGLAFNGVVIVLVLIACAIPACRTRCFTIQRSSACLLVMQSVLTGLVVGLFIHFIPCLWWTCDWGPDDGQAIRGGIWFVVWGAVSISICACGCRSRADLGSAGNASMKLEDLGS